MKHIAIAFFIIITPLQALTAVPALCEVMERDMSWNIDSRSTFFLDIDIDAAEVKVKPGTHGDECKVSLEYDDFYFVPCLDYDSRDNRLEVVIDCDNLFHHEDCGDCGDCDSCGDHDCSDGTCCSHKKCRKMEIVIELPFDPETEIDAEIKAGEVEFQLGGLAVTDFRLRCLAGETTVEFDSPNRALLRDFDVNISIGETNLVKLGNGRIEDAVINSGIGELDVDFSGVSCDNLHARIDLDVGETDIKVPSEIGVKVHVSRFMFFSNMDCPRSFNKRGRNYYSPNYDSSDERLTLDISAGIGELRLRTESCSASRF